MQRLKQANDNALIRLFRLGNNRAFDELTARYEKKLKASLHKILHNVALEKDVLQDLWVEVITRLRSRLLYKEQGITHLKQIMEKIERSQFL